MQLTNERLTAASIVKAFLDISLPYTSLETEGWGPLWRASSPIAETIIDVLWMIPAFAPLADSHSPQTIVQVAGNVWFNLTGIISIFVSLDLEPDTRSALELLITGTTLSYGGAMLLSSFLSVNNLPTTSKGRGHPLPLLAT